MGFWPPPKSPLCRAFRNEKHYVRVSSYSWLLLAFLLELLRNDETFVHNIKNEVFFRLGGL